MTTGDGSRALEQSVPAVQGYLSCRRMEGETRQRSSMIEGGEPEEYKA